MTSLLDTRIVKRLTLAAGAACLATAGSTAPLAKEKLQDEPIRIVITEAVIKNNNALPDIVSPATYDEQVEWEFVNETNVKVKFKFEYFIVSETPILVEPIDFEGSASGTLGAKGTGSATKRRRGKVKLDMGIGTACVKYALTIETDDLPPTLQDPRLEIVRPGPITKGAASVVPKTTGRTTGCGK